MLSLLRKFSFGVLLLTSTGFAAFAGYLAYTGFELMIDLPLVGWIGPLVSASCIGLGLATEIELRRVPWKLMNSFFGVFKVLASCIPAGVLLVLLAVCGLLDRHSGELALISKINQAEQAFLDSQAAYDTAMSIKADKLKANEELNAELKNLQTQNFEEIVEIQLSLAALGYYKDLPATEYQPAVKATIDGKRGAATLKAMNNRGVDIRADIKANEADIKKALEVEANGKPVLETPFDLHDASIYATLITLFSILFAFAASWISHDPNEKTEDIDDVLDEAESVASEMEAALVEMFKITNGDRQLSPAVPRYKVRDEKKRA